MAFAREHKNNSSPSFQFVINPSAGKGKYEQIINAIRETLSDRGLQYDIKVLEYRGQATVVAKAAAETHDVVVAVGGDGTVNEVFNGLVGTKAIFGIIPAGTGNGFARELGLPLKPAEACRVLAEGNIKSMDVGVVNDRYFLGTAGVGFDALISRFAGEKLGPLRGMWLYFIAGASVFFKYTPQLVNVEIDSETVEIAPLLIAVANTARYGGTALIAPEAKPDDGLLDVCIIREMGAARLLWHLPKLFTGKHVRLPDVTMYKGKNIAITAPEPIPVHVDGEAIDSRSRVEFTLLPNAIKVLIPEETQV
ncbi:diacylglycerol/lipid kinase family protein [Candidatus Poribacteria bacterium]